MNNKPLSDQTLKELGFKSIIPSGNSKEPIWEHPRLSYSMHNRPTAKQIFDEIERQAYEEGQSDLREKFRDLMDL